MLVLDNKRYSKADYIFLYLSIYLFSYLSIHLSVPMYLFHASSTELSHWDNLRKEPPLVPIHRFHCFATLPFHFAICNFVSPYALCFHVMYASIHSLYIHKIELILKLFSHIIICPSNLITHCL